jgi:hypothetical protein
MPKGMQRATLLQSIIVSPRFVSGEMLELASFWTRACKTERRASTVAGVRVNAIEMLMEEQYIPFDRPSTA